MWVPGATGTKVWLGVEVAKDKRSVTGWMFSGELRGRIGGDRRWWEKLRGKGREWWIVQRHK